VTGGGAKAVNPLNGTSLFRLLASVGVSAAVISLGGPAQSSPAAEPLGQATQSQGANPVVTYRDAAGHVHVVRFPSSVGAPVDPTDTDLNGEAGGPPAAGTPTGYASVMDGAPAAEHVDYRTASGRVLDLSRSASSVGWRLTDLTASAHTASRAGGDVVGWDQGYPLHRQWVAYRDTDGHLHALTRAATPDSWQDLDLRAAAHVKTTATTDPTMFVDTNSSTANPILVYAGADGDAHVLEWQPGSDVKAWQDTDVSAEAKVKAVPVSRPYGWASTQPATIRDELHVIYRTKDGRVHEFFGGREHQWKETDLYHYGRAMVVATGDVQGSVGTDELGQDFEIIQYRGGDGKLHRIFYRWLSYVEQPADDWSDVSTGVPIRSLGLWLRSQDTADTIYVSGGHLWASERFWGGEVTTDTDLTESAGAQVPAPGTGTGGYFVGPG